VTFPVIALAIAILTGCTTATPAAILVEKERFEEEKEQIVVQRPDGSDVVALIEKPKGGASLPVILYIDGSGCVSATREKFIKVQHRPAWVHSASATMIVEKPGVTPGAAWGSKCTTEFAKYYSIDQRVFDHLLVFQYLRAKADWWNGEIYLVGWSDGAAIGSHVLAYTPEVKKAILGGMGGGIPMWKQFEDYIFCPEDSTENRAQCIAGVRKNFDKIRNNPSPTKFWSGGDNSYKVWASRLDQVEYYLLRNATIPLLIMHGELDHESVPVQAARELIRKLLADEHSSFEYWEVPKMGHGIGNLEEKRAEKVRTAMVNWLFDKPLGDGGPPNFGTEKSSQ